ncbi:hypothetical protein MMC30_009378 [Trapelia coarctata]|nr:hypothetical protein [Trapelia coarctata]
MSFLWLRYQANDKVADGNGINRYAGSTVAITQCKDGSYCCAYLNNTCCDQAQGVHIAETVGFSASTTILTSTTIPSTTTSTATSTATSIGGSTTFTTAPSSTNADPSTGLSTGQSVGMGLGTGLGVVVFVIAGGAGWWFMVRNKRAAWKARRPYQMKDEFHEAPPAEWELSHELCGMRGKGPRTADMEALPRSQELRGTEVFAELPLNYVVQDRP